MGWARTWGANLATKFDSLWLQAMTMTLRHVLLFGAKTSKILMFCWLAVCQEPFRTGVAPTDDGFTILERSEEFEQFEDPLVSRRCTGMLSFLLWPGWLLHWS